MSQRLSQKQRRPGMIVAQRCRKTKDMNEFSIVMKHKPKTKVETLCHLEVIDGGTTVHEVRIVEHYAK